MLMADAGCNASWEEPIKIRAQDGSIKYASLSFFLSFFIYIFFQINMHALLSDEGFL